LVETNLTIYLEKTQHKLKNIPHKPINKIGKTTTQTKTHKSTSNNANKISTFGQKTPGKTYLNNA